MFIQAFMKPRVVTVVAILLVLTVAPSLGLAAFVDSIGIDYTCNQSTQDQPNYSHNLINRVAGTILPAQVGDRVLLLSGSHACRLENCLTPARLLLINTSALNYSDMINLKVQHIKGLTGVIGSYPRSRPVTSKEADPMALPDLREEPLTLTLGEQIAKPSKVQVASLNSWLWYTIPLASLLALIITPIVLKRLQNRYVWESNALTDEIRAYLILHDDKDTRFVISQPRWRIGRDQDNELRLTDNSVSRHHAEILRNRDGTFEIRDLDSLNGVFVNDKKIYSTVLKEGDEIDIGDVRLTFMLHEDYPSTLEKTLG